MIQWTTTRENLTLYAINTTFPCCQNFFHQTVFISRTLYIELFDIHFTWKLFYILKFFFYLLLTQNGCKIEIYFIFVKNRQVILSSLIFRLFLVVFDFDMNQISMTVRGVYNQNQIEYERRRGLARPSTEMGQVPEAYRDVSYSNIIYII